MNQPGAGDGMGEHGADRGRLDHRAEGIIIVDAGSLGEAMKDPASLVPLQRAIGVELVYKNPFTVMTLEPTGRGTRSQVLLAIKVANSSSMSRRQFGSMRATWTEERTDDKVDVEVADRVSLSVSSQKPRFTHVVIK
jgi:hypothetical protein